MKKKILSIALVVAMVAVIAAGSLAYFTDKDSAKNTFTVGNVKIDLIESRFHREGNDNSNDSSIPDPENTASGMKYVTDGHKAFTDAEIQNDAQTYAKDYLEVKGEKMVPGRNVAKCPYVINTGVNDAYVRIRVMVPSAANNDFVSVKKGGVITNQWCSTSMISGEFIDGKGGGWNNAPFIDRNVDVNGVKYDVYTFVRTAPLAAGAMTEWNVWNFIGIDKNATAADIQKAIEAGAITVKNDVTTFGVLIQADAIQAEGFADATAAFAAFDAQGK